LQKCECTTLPLTDSVYRLIEGINYAADTAFLYRKVRNKPFTVFDNDDSPIFDDSTARFKFESNGYQAIHYQDKSFVLMSFETTLGRAFITFNHNGDFIDGFMGYKDFVWNHGHGHTTRQTKIEKDLTIKVLQTYGPSDVAADEEDYYSYKALMKVNPAGKFTKIKTDYVKGPDADMSYPPEFFK
jgi:hypothetical protein